MKLTKTLYRFDVNQRIQNLNCECVDFIVNDNVYRVQVENEVCKIPDEFLQNAGNQKFYECYANGTKCEHLVSIRDRPQPPDYVYTPTEHETFDSLVEKVNVTIDGVPEYINNYFTEHRDEFKGDPYVLTEADKNEIVDTVVNEIINPLETMIDESGVLA